jgi:hypothetical protein
MFVATITKIDHHWPKIWIEFTDIKFETYNETNLPENYTADEFSKVLSYYNQLSPLLAKKANEEFVLREIIRNPNGNYIIVRVALSPESLESWRTDFLSLTTARDELLEMVNATMTNKDVNCNTYNDILKILKCSYDQLNSIYFQS